MIQNLFKRLDIVIDIDFLVVEEIIPNLLSMKDVLDNELDISIQERYLSLGEDANH